MAVWVTKFSNGREVLFSTKEKALGAGIDYIASIKELSDAEVDKFTKELYASYDRGDNVIWSNPFVISELREVV